MAMEPTPSLGLVKWFDRKKGFGFLVVLAERSPERILDFLDDEEAGKLAPLVDPDGNEVEAFIHYENIRGEGYRKLLTGDLVSFTLESTDRGYAARELELLAHAEMPGEVDDIGDLDD